LKHGILVVEDNQPNRELLCDWLELEGYEVRSAADLKASYEAFAERLPDAVLLDINLGGENASTSSHGCAKNRSCGNPVIAVTAHALVTEQLGILQAGCRACLSKPINFQGLREQLNHSLQDRTVSRPNS